MTEDQDAEPGSLEIAEAEREAMYPMTGYVLVRIDYSEPPGEALTKVEQHGSLTTVTMPDDGPMHTYVVYDADGNAYGRTDLATE